MTEQVAAEKRKATVSRDLKARKQSLFMDDLLLNVEADEAVDAASEAERQWRFAKDALK